MTKSKSKNVTQKRTTGTEPVVESSKSLTRKRREERQRQKQRNRQITFAAVVVVIAIIAIIGFVVATQPASAPIPEGTLERYAGIPQGVTSEGFARLGRADAPVRLEEFSSFSCEHCQDFWETSFAEIVQLVREGKISFTFIPMLTGGVQNAGGAQTAAICAGEQGMFYEYHDMLFDWHARYVNRAFSQNRFNSGADALGLDTGAFSSCLSSSRASDLVQAGVDEATARGVGGTPATYLNGTEIESSMTNIRQRVDEEIARLGVVPIPITSEEDASAVEVTPEATADLPPETTEEPLDSDVTPEATPEATPEVTPETTGG